MVLLLALLTLSCGRPLTEGETALAQSIHGDTLDIPRTRIVHGPGMRSFTMTRQKRPRLTCRERIVPEPTSDTVITSPAGVVWLNHIVMEKDWFLDDYLPGYPDKMHLGAAMLFAHEITHVWQWQNRAKTGYSPFRAAREHQVSEDPYLFDVATRTAFLDQGYEQQAAIVEEYVCCATLDPQAPRTRRLEELLRGAFPLDRLSIPDDVVLPWDGAQTRGICR